jgi:GMP synthase-like glutamine amidotransferase
VTVGILQCGDPPEALRAEYGSYGAMVARLLGPARSTVVHDVTAGALPASATACNAYVLTGSPAGIYENLPWIPGLIGFLQQARGWAKLVGICFGHQAMAQAFGGQVIKSPNGWGMGLQRYHVRHRAPWMDDAVEVRVPASHQDQVVACPPGARVTAINPFTPYAGLDYGDAISFQFHSEFTPAFGTALVEYRRGKYGAGADAAAASYKLTNDCARVGGWISRFLDASGLPRGYGEA